MPKRIQSPSSVNTFKQCKRKYYYQYIEKIPTSSSIHTVRGNIVHSVLEDFYDTDVTMFAADAYKMQFKIALQKLMLKQWGKYQKELQGLHMQKEELMQYFEESMMMVLNWGDQFLHDFETRLSAHQHSLSQTFLTMTPLRELEYKSLAHGVRGFIDAIQEIDGEVHIIDYKTNKRAEIKPSIRLQLAIYSLMYEEKHGKLPDKLGVYFLRDKLHTLEATPNDVESAKKELQTIHKHTEDNEDPMTYPRTVTGLCKWKTGQCDFYNICKPHSNR
jgi:CRISPR/Cas system-associated exonuclease Cas4 (RecB family)